MAQSHPVIVRGDASGPPPWHAAAAGARTLTLGEPPSESARAAVRAAGCALVDGTTPHPVEMSRGVHRVDPALQIVIVAPPEEHATIRRAMLFARGLGEVWVVVPEEVGAELVQRATSVTMQRRAYRATQGQIEHDLALLEPHAPHRAVISDAYLAALLGVLPDPVMSIDENGRVLTWNVASEQVLGYARKNAVGKPLIELLAPEHPDGGRMAELPGRAARQEIRFLSREGGVGVGELTIVPVEAAGHRVRAVVLHEVTEERRLQAQREAQAAELEAQAEELQSHALQLEQTQAELEAANQVLQRTNTALAERTAEAERERAGAEAARAHLEAVLHQMPSGVLLADAFTGRLLLSNGQVEAILRQPFQAGAELSGSRPLVARHPDGRPYQPDEWPLARSLAHGEIVLNEEIAVVRGDGERATISVNSAPVRDQHGRVLAAVAIFDDITVSKAREEAQAFLAEASRALSSSLDYRETLRSVARLAVPRMADWCAVDVLEEGQLRRLTTVHSDPAREDLADEAARRWPTDLDASRGVPQVLRTGESELFPEIPEKLLRAIAQDEEHFRVLREVGLRSAMIVPLIARGRTLGTITLIAAESGRRFDAEDLELAEELASRAAFAVDNARLYEEAQSMRAAAETASRAKSDFLATMSHEIRTPINAIIGYTDLVELGTAGPITESQRSHLGRVRASSQHLLGLIEDILDLSKVEAGRMEVAHERVLTAQVIAPALALVAPQAAENRIEIQAPGVDDQGTYFMGDEDRVRQILVNLLTNAVKFTEAGGVIRVTCGMTSQGGPATERREEGSWTYLRVRDTGAGIAPEELDAVFGAFVQAEGGLTRTKGGTGLGLTISRQLARLMGGDLTAESELGVGSTFTLWLRSDAAGAVRPDETILKEVRADAPPRGIGRMGVALREEIGGIIDAFVARLTTDPQVPIAATLIPGELEDHISTLLAGISQEMVVLETSDYDGTTLLRDGTEIQRVISELHGAQRARLGWTEGALRRQFVVLVEEIEAAIRRKVSSSKESEVQESLALVRRFIQHAEGISVRALRRVLAAQP